MDEPECKNIHNSNMSRQYSHSKVFPHSGKGVVYQAMWNHIQKPFPSIKQLRYNSFICVCVDTSWRKHALLHAYDDRHAKICRNDDNVYRLSETSHVQ